MRWASVLALGCVLAQGCRCGRDVLTPEPPPALSVSPPRLVLAATYRGQASAGSVSVSNGGGRSEALPVSIEAPFSDEVTEVTLGRGDEETVLVRFPATEVGRAVGTLRVGALTVPVEAEALEVPMCNASSACIDARFDASAAQCVEVQRADGASCETRCVTGGCANGTCVGQLKGCDDGDACTTDVCDEATGCDHPLVSCPAPGECQLAVCRKATGCAVEEVPDGTLCGVDDCLATQVDVCVSGACVRRPRPDTGRCANRWVPTSIPARTGHAMAFDAARQRVVLFGGGWAGKNNGRSIDSGAMSDTWEWDGNARTQRTPVTSPPARVDHAMASDAVRQRMALLDGYTLWYLLP